MKSIRRCQFLISLFIVLFIAGMVALVVKIHREAKFYMTHSGTMSLGKVYDRHGDVLYTGTDDDGSSYPDNYFIDVGSLIGDDSGQMENTLVARNTDKLNNYSFTAGLVREGGKAAIYTTLDHEANRTVYDAFGSQKGCAVAYNYKTGELLVCTSLPNIDVTKGYDNIANFESGTLISKVMYGTVPGSTQKVSTVITALEIMGADRLFAKRYTCEGHYTNKTGGVIDCHNIYGHGEQDIQQALENSCNPFFAQLVADSDMPLNKIKKIYEKLGYAINGEEMEYFDIDGIQCERASTTLEDTDDFRTQWGCIGQGDTLVSPMQLMMWQSAIANGTGKMTIPHLIAKVTDVYGDVCERGHTEFSEQLFTDDNAACVRQMMLTNGANHYSELIPGYSLGVKSGTAQVDEGAKENSLLVGFVDDEDFPIAFCILIEDKDSGSVKTDQIAKILLDALSE